jgi:hypothetical protein
MAGHDDRNRVRAISAADGAHCAGGADGRCDFRVAARLAVRDLAEGIPDAALKRGAAKIEWKLEHRPLAIEVFLKLAESALFRGLIHKDGDWKLNIDVDENEHGLFIQVSDNGVGLATKAPPGSGPERRDDIEAAETILKGYFTGMQPVNILCSGMYNRVTILIPRS